MAKKANVEDIIDNSELEESIKFVLSKLDELTTKVNDLPALEDKQDVDNDQLVELQNQINELKSIKSIRDSFITTGGLKIYTNLDINAQRVLENSINSSIKDKKLQTAGIMMNPNNGKIIALVGGLNYDESQYNRATKSFRQVVTATSDGAIAAHSAKEFIDSVKDGKK